MATIEKQPSLVAAQLPQPSPTSAITLLRARLQRDGTPVKSAKSVISNDELEFIARRLPLNPVPYTARATMAVEQGDTARGIQLYEIARKLDPRSIPVRMSLARAYLGSGREAEGIGEIFDSAELRSSQAKSAFFLLQAIGNQPQIAELVVKAVTAQPRRAELYYSNLPASEAARPLSRALFRSAPPRPIFASQFVDVLLAQGYVKDALALAQATKMLPQEEALNWPRNAEFKLPLGRSAFDWRDMSREKGRVAIIEGAQQGANSGLNVTFSGSGKEKLLEQTMLLAPGQYSWTIPYEITFISGSGEAFEWTISCPDGRILGSAKLSPESDEAGELGLRITVPEKGCAAQSFALLGSSPSRLSEIDVIFSGIRTPQKDVRK